MEAYVIDIENILIQRLKNVGVESPIIPRFIKDLLNAFSDDPDRNLFELNRDLDLLGWGDVKLDYHTFQLAMAFFENEGLKKDVKQARNIWDTSYERRYSGNKR